MGRLIPALLLAGGWLTSCLVRDPIDDRYPDVTLRSPTLESASVVCDGEGAKWELELRVTAWSGGATTAWTVDGDYVELHDLVRASWEPDGSFEILSLTLPIVDDWREVTDTSTVFTCGADPSGALELYDPDGAVVACRAWGPSPELFDALPDTPRCDVPLETPP